MILTCSFTRGYFRFLVSYRLLMCVFSRVSFYTANFLYYNYLDPDLNFTSLIRDILKFALCAKTTTNALVKTCLNIFVTCPANVYMLRYSRNRDWLTLVTLRRFHIYA